jgi:hypothetical protein
MCQWKVDNLGGYSRRRWKAVVLVNLAYTLGRPTAESSMLYSIWFIFRLATNLSHAPHLTHHLSDRRKIHSTSDVAVATMRL